MILEINNEKHFEQLRLLANYFLRVAVNLVRKIPNVGKKFNIDSHFFNRYTATSKICANFEFNGVGLLK